MLYTRETRKRLDQEMTEFNRSYLEILEEMRRVMKERGQIRDTETPIYYRRSPEACLGLAVNKGLRIESLLGKLDREDPQREYLEGIVEECWDAANYMIFIAATCNLILKEFLEFNSAELTML